MKINVGFPLDYGFRFADCKSDKQEGILSFSAEKIRRIGSKVCMEIRDGVLLSVEYIEDYNETTSFDEYEKRAKDYACSVIEEIKKAQ